MAAKDIKEILSLPAGSQPVLKQRSHQPVPKRPEGITRELFALTGGAPPLTLSVVPKATFKPKISFGAAAVDSEKPEKVRWILASIKNPGNDCVLTHWVKESDADKDYPFAVFNESVSVPDFTDEEYTQHLEDPEWSKEETRYLMSLCKRYDMRFVIVTDRYEYNGQPRSIEDIKERFYGVLKKIQLARAAASGVTLDPPPFTFNKAREIERKRNVEILNSRTAEIIKEEEALYFELRKREQNEKKWAAEREKIVRLLSNHELSVPLNKIKKVGSKSEDVVSETVAGLRKDRKLSSKLLEDYVEAPLKREKLPPGVYMRTARLFGPKQSYQTKVKEIMEEYGLPSVPVMPTAAVCEKFDAVRANIVTLLDLKKMVDRQELDLRVLEQRKELLLQGASASTPMSATSSDPGGLAANKKVWT
ncbi:swr complex subunit [Irineochytrium annulatum]|nr:swr complex subunit [Irineochytrium annulatum]